MQENGFFFAMKQTKLLYLHVMSTSIHSLNKAAGN